MRRVTSRIYKNSKNIAKRYNEYKDNQPISEYRYFLKGARYLADCEKDVKLLFGESYLHIDTQEAVDGFHIIVYLTAPQIFCLSQ